jgi:hypothetical protein
MAIAGRFFNVTAALTFVAVAIVMSCARTAAAAAEAPSAPPGLQPTSTTLAAVIASAKKAYGRPTRSDAALTEQWTTTDAGDVENGSSVSVGADYAITLTTVGLTRRYGEYKGRGWEQNENGIVTLLAGVHGNARSSLDDTWRAAQADGARLLGEVQSPASAYVVETVSARGRSMWLFFDKASALLDRAVVFYPGGQYTYDFSSYRSVGGVAEAEHIHGSGDRSADAFDTAVTSRTYSESFAPSSLAIPANRSDLVEFPPGRSSIRLPVRIMDGRFIIVRVNINGRGLDFILDSGADGIVIERGVAEELGLRTVGDTRREGKANVQYHVVAPEIDVGDLRMRNVVIQSLPFDAGQEETTKVVGLLGFDFLAGAALKVDYDHGTLDAFPASSFDPPAGAKPIAVALDDQVPMISCQINDITAKYLILDTGADDLYVYSHFAIAHFAGSPDPRKNEFKTIYLPFYKDIVVGGLVQTAQFRAASFVLGEYYFGGPLLYVIWHAPRFEDVMVDSDGIIGHSLLLYFDLYFDYPHARIYMVPNATYQAVSKTAGGR